MAKSAWASDCARIVGSCVSGCGESSCECRGCGRTDTGVHASGQVVHFDTTAARSDRAWLMGSNSNLSKDMCVLWAKPVPEDFMRDFPQQQDDIAISFVIHL